MAYAQDIERTAVASGMGRDPADLHDIDYQDVSISSQAVTLIRKAAHAILERHMPGGRTEGLTTREAIALFIDRLFWDSVSGGLVMCMDMADKTFCLPIPKEFWKVRTQGPVQ